MFTKSSLLRAGAFLTLTVAGGWVVVFELWSTPSQNATVPNTELQLVSEFKNSLLLDVSANGAWLLFYTTRTPADLHSVSKREIISKHNEASVGELMIVDAATGRELHKIMVRSFPTSARFVPNVGGVVFVAQDANGGSSRIGKWDLRENKLESCSFSEELSFVPIGFLDAHRVLGISLRSTGGDLLVERIVSECQNKNIAPIDPGNPEMRSWGNSQLHNDLFLLTTYGGQKLIIWDRDTKKSSTMAPPRSVFFGSTVMYASGAKKFIVTASTHPFAGSGTKNYVLLYSGDSFKLERQIEIPSNSEVAIDPEGRLLAVGYTKPLGGLLSPSHESLVSLYDLRTSQKIGEATHAVIQGEASDPFADKISRLSFTPDGKFLLSSSYNTKMWMVRTLR